MKQLAISAVELQTLVATALRDKLRAAGFKLGPGDGQERSCFTIPVNLGMTGNCQLTYHEDGTWLFEQEDDATVADRTQDTFQSHFDAVRAAALKNAGA